VSAADHQRHAGAEAPASAAAGPVTGRAAAEWLARCEPPAPPALAARVAALLGDAPLADTEDAVARCVAAAERVVAGLLREACTDRASALDLLAADALATYAFELAGEHPETLATAADAAMLRFAALGTLPGAGAPVAGAAGGAMPNARA
jgi:hypothetical protein